MEPKVRQDTAFCPVQSPCRARLVFLKSSKQPQKRRLREISSLVLSRAVHDPGLPTLSPLLSLPPQISQIHQGILHHLLGSLSHPLNFASRGPGTDVAGTSFILKDKSREDEPARPEVPSGGRRTRENRPAALTCWRILLFNKNELSFNLIFFLLTLIFY